MWISSTGFVALVSSSSIAFLSRATTLTAQRCPKTWQHHQGFSAGFHLVWTLQDLAVKTLYAKCRSLRACRSAAMTLTIQILFMFLKILRIIIRAELYVVNWVPEHIVSSMRPPKPIAKVDQSTSGNRKAWPENTETATSSLTLPVPPQRTPWPSWLSSASSWPFNCYLSLLFILLSFYCQFMYQVFLFGV